MENSSSDIKDVYKDIYTINDYFYEDNGQLIVNTKHKSIDDYCHSWCDSGEGICHDYFQLASCSVFYLLNNLMDKFDSKYDKLVEYAILWLSYKLNQHSKHSGTNLNDFYTNYIEKNNDYNNTINDDDNMTYKEIINRKKDLIDMNINEISKFNRPFNILFQMYYNYHVEDWNYDKNLGYAKSFAEEFEELNEYSKNREGSPYTQILSTLSNDYDNLKNKYSENISCNFPSISKVNLPKSSVENYGKVDEQILGQSSYSIEDVYTVFNKIDREFGVNADGSEFANESIHQYCPYINPTASNYCLDYFQSASSGVFHLLTNLKDKNGLEDDKLAEYAILWLSYKLNQHSKHSGTKLNDFYTNHIENNNYYNKNIKDNGSTYKDIIDKRKDLMNMNINEISKFNYPFSILCSLYKGIKKNGLDCTKYSIPANNFADVFEKLNNDSSIIGNASYRKLLSTLSDDYNNLKNKYGNDESCDFPTLSPVKTSLSSSIASKLIPGLSTFAIPAFLGIAYKYSLFGIDKVFQRQYIRNKLKKIKNKMKLNI
ncbi:hypothetical protein YYE_04987 [Plasmodium vinckei vinckei]|uniref:PIR protein CIR protein n=1 Tax=Plasmodium vinckei vinckei TaxID=54757 RepID=A0A081I905_PLAVN|nr:hypothetical protein YYE_04987 [Plasmodium vinckei vinckei]